MQPVSLALFWHQHQPYYPDDLTGETLMPWVRLHGTKDYIGMALHIAEVPEVRCTINLVPSLLKQIQRYVDGGSDRHLDVSRLAADALSEEDAVYLLDNFFMANEPSMIRPHERYRDLYLRRGFGRDTAKQALTRFSTGNLRDLQVWNNLTWFHELLFASDSALREFRAKGSGWTEKEKLWLLERQREILAEIIPLHKKLQDGGQVEITTTPFYHPILPLLWDKKSAREAMPGCPLPKYTEPYPDDAIAQIQRGVNLYTKTFGQPPRGMWPSEGSVSQAIIPAIADAGIDWIATDEEILTRSTDGFVHRDGQGHINRPEMLFRPWRVEQDGKSLQMVFRDHGLSDLIGFHYQRNEPNWAADDLLAKVKEIGRAVRGHNAEVPALVPVILDGENCWEYYPDGGVQFLRRLYQQTAGDPLVQPVRVSDHLSAYPATQKITRLFAGSWIQHDFYIWIGHQEDRDAWDLVHITREFLKHASRSGKIDRQSLDQAWEELYIAEGSDWYWWFGDDRNSAQDALFDELFRRHLRNVYTLLGELPPSALLRPITRVERRQLHTQPRAFLKVKVDGRMSYFEWIHAGHYKTGSSRGTMTMVSEGLLTDVYFGFDAQTLFIRADTDGRALHDLRLFDEVRVRFLEPYGTELRLKCTAGRQQVTVLRDGAAVEPPSAVGEIDRIVELSVPFKDLGVSTGQSLQMALEVIKGDESLDRAPNEGTLDLSVPPPDFEMYHWQA